MENDILPKTPQNDNVSTTDRTDSNILRSDIKIVALVFLLIFLTLTALAGVVISLYRSQEKENSSSLRKIGETEKNGSSQIVQQKVTTGTENDVGTVVDTNQRYCFDDKNAIVCGADFNGQDAQYQGTQPNYLDNYDGTITDLNTGLMWIKNAGDKQDYYSAVNSANSYTYAGYYDWRVPTIKELYTLMDFNGTDPSSTSENTSGLEPFLNDNYFDFEYGNLTKADRIIDSQWMTSNIYVSKVMDGQECFFGVNFADGRIKCYPTQNQRNNGYYLRLVRGESYGLNDFVDNGDGTVTDSSSGLVWQKSDSKKGMDWAGALSYCENLELGGSSDWRLPNAKELQYIVDYTRSPDTTGTAAIDPVFESTSIINEAGQKDFPFYWTGTTHIQSNGSVYNAVYISFGRALGKMNNKIMDVHGAGAQRSDPKSGSISDYPIYMGPQGDVRRLYNYVRCVTGGNITRSNGEDPSTFNVSRTSLPSQGPKQGQGQGSLQDHTQSQNLNRPPESAFTACVGKQENYICSMSTPLGDLPGHCMRFEDQLACIPE